jgi:hypothetical protein
MYCTKCGTKFQEETRFCGKCGAEIGSAAIPSKPAGNKGWVTRHPIWASLIALWVMGMVAGVAVEKRGQATQPVPQNNLAQVSSGSPVGVPAFHLFKLKPDGPITFVVSKATTDEELKGLLWFFRTSVRTGKFKDIGITQPTARQYGQLGYMSGMLLVYKGEKCANEEYISTSELEKGHLGPCGYGEHDDAYYQWGIDGDPLKDGAGMTAVNGNFIAVFDYTDDWHPSSEVLRDFDENVKEEWKAKQREWEPMQRIAVQMTNLLNQKGIDVTASANDNQPKQLDLESPLFKNTNFRQQFIENGMPQIHDDLCNAGFQSIRILQGSIADGGQIVPLHCR